MSLSELIAAPFASFHVAFSLARAAKTASTLLPMIPTPCSSPTASTIPGCALISSRLNETGPEPLYFWPSGGDNPKFPKSNYAPLYYKNGLSALRSDKTSNYLFGEENSKGFYPLQSRFTNWRTATPTGEGDSSSNTAIYIGIIVVVVVIAVVGGLVTMRRRVTAAERE